MMGGIIAGILIIIVLLALLGLGWDTFVSGVKKVQYRLLKMELGI
jgi:hypothetical protein